MNLENEAATGDEVEVEKSMDDTIRETLASLRERGMEPHAEVDAAPADEAAEAPSRARAPDGKFAAKVEADTPIEAAAPAPIAPVEEPEIAAAPNTWRKDAQSTWNALPAEARREIQRREQDFHRGIEQYKQAAEFTREFANAVRPFEATIRTTGLHPIKAVEQLLSSDHLLRYGTPAQKAEKFQAMAQHYGIDMAGAANYAPEAVDPQIAALRQQVEQLTGYLQNQQVSSQQAEEQTLHSEIARFAADPAHVHFASVKEHMAALLQAGLAPDLKTAYEQAIYANPQVRNAVLQQQTQAQREEANRKAAAAREAASVNVRSRPAMPAGVPQGQTMNETIRDTYRRLVG